MKVAKLIIGVLGIFITIPISVYLQYQIMERVQATDVMWLLFWVNVPIILIIQILSKIAEGGGE